MNSTIDYYNKNAMEFTSTTQNVDMTNLYCVFEKYLKLGNAILDFGCGSGRDSKYFIQKGYEVTAIDGSEEMCKIASEYIGQSVEHMYFKQLSCIEEFNGIWACSSILHVRKQNLADIFKRMGRALKNNGVIYTSFKYGDSEEQRDSRFFSNFTENSFSEFMEQVDNLIIEKMFLTGDVRPGRGEEKWLNVILKKI